MKTLIVTSILALSLNSVAAFAGGDDEYVEADPYPGDGGAVSPPTTPGGLIGPSVGGGGGPAPSAAAVAATTKVSAKNIKEKKKKDKKFSWSNVMDIVLGIFEPAYEMAKQGVNQVVEVVHDMNWVQIEKDKSRIIRRDPQTGVIIYEEQANKCKSTQFNDHTEDPCTNMNIQPYVDPTQPNVKMYRLQMSVMRGIYNPARDDADGQGYVFSADTSTMMYFIFKDEADLRNQLMELYKQ